VARIYKILARAEWDAARAAGRFDGSAVDARDGFIHFSTAGQAAETLRLHFAGQTGLVLLQIDVEALGGAIKWEPSRGGQLFPHLYGALDCAAVEAVIEIADAEPRLGALAP